jgi:hypothetical protein
MQLGKSAGTRGRKNNKTLLASLRQTREYGRAKASESREVRRRIRRKKENIPGQEKIAKYF